MNRQEMDIITALFTTALSVVMTGILMLILVCHTIAIHTDITQVQVLTITTTQQRALILMLLHTMQVVQEE
jgi:hypothetical protein